MTKHAIVFFLILVTATAGCSSMKKSSANNIAGIWEGAYPNGAQVRLEFRNDNTMKANIRGQQDIEFSGKYSVDYGKKPMQIDLYGFDASEMDRNARYMGIIEFRDDNTLLIDGSMEGSRPSSFSDFAVSLTRKQ